MRRRSFLALAASMALVSQRHVSAAQTPVAVTGETGLAMLAHWIPADAFGESGVKYANYKAQRSALGIVETGADIDPDAWMAAMRAPMMVPDAMMSPLEPMWREGLGFDLRDVDQMAGVGSSDQSILLMTGQFDQATLTAAWEAGGYAPTETGGVTWYTLGADNVLFDPDVPLSDYHVGMLSHLALLDDATIVGTAKRVDMEQVLALHAGDGASMATGPAEALITAPVELAAGWIVDGMALVSVGDPLGAMINNPNIPADVQERLATQAAEMAEETPRMPPIALAMIGVTAGTATSSTAEAFPDAPAARAIGVVVPAEAADAAMVAETVTRRLTTLAIVGPEQYNGRPYAEVFPEMVIDTTPDGAVLIDLAPADEVPAALLMELLAARNLTVLAWGV